MKYALLHFVAIVVVSTSLVHNVTGKMGFVGGIKDIDLSTANAVELSGLCNFAIKEYNEKNSASLLFKKLLKAQSQVVAGTKYILTMEASNGVNNQNYVADVLVQPWRNSSELLSFEPAGTNSSAACDGQVQENHEHGWQIVTAREPVIQDVANHAVKAIQQRSNSLLPYELVDVLCARIKEIEDVCKFALLLKVKRGNKEEKFKVELDKSLEDNFQLNMVQQEHSH